MDKSQIIGITEDIDTALFEGGLSPEYGKTLIKTNIFLRQQLNKVNAVCKDCGHNLHTEDYREEVDGDILCEDCLLIADKAYWEDVKMKEDYLQS